MRRTTVATAVLLSMACTDLPTERVQGVEPLPSWARAAFQLRIDALTGMVTVSAHAPGHTGGASYSILGSDAVSLHATGCTWTDLSKKQRRCTLGLTVENRLASTDLMAPTLFPPGPTGMSGYLLFPYSVTGTPAGSATPSPEWDNPPSNFFGEGCTPKTTTCFRSKTFPAPLYGADTSPERMVGFDVDHSATAVSALILVAADLRDNPATVVEAEYVHCNVGGPGVPLTPYLGYVAVGNGLHSYWKIPGPKRTACTFALPDVLTSDLHVTAVLTANQLETPQFPFDHLGTIVVDHVSFDARDDAADPATIFSGPALVENLATLSTDPSAGPRNADVSIAVAADIERLPEFGYRFSQYRLRFTDDEALEDAGVVEFGRFTSPGPFQHPRLIISYRKR